MNTMPDTPAPDIPPADRDATADAACAAACALSRFPAHVWRGLLRPPFR